ncbi:MAG TPA: hypothetical protein VGM46_01770 [Mesorhizobium sp.]|jgi:ElaB/YqjD/DUF883 family membrane-anchored ribosome-binding protein
MPSFSDMTDIDLEKQIASLSKELAALKKTASKRGKAYYDEGRDAAWDSYSDLAERISDALPGLRKRAKVIEGTARDHPATAAAVGLVVVGLVAAMLFNRR